MMKTQDSVSAIFCLSLSLSRSTNGAHVHIILASNEQQKNTFSSMIHLFLISELFLTIASGIHHHYSFMLSSQFVFSFRINFMPFPRCLCVHRKLSIPNAIPFVRSMFVSPLITRRQFGVEVTG